MVPVVVGVFIYYLPVSLRPGKERRRAWLDFRFRRNHFKDSLRKTSPPGVFSLRDTSQLHWQGAHIDSALAWGIGDDPF